MKKCNCTSTVQSNYGLTDDGKCGFCLGVRAEAVSTNTKGHGSPNGGSGTVNQSSTKSSLTEDKLRPRLAGIDNIITRMWFWILSQALFFGLVAGNVFSDGYSFSWGAAFSAFLGGIGAFAPLVFVVQALREVIIGIAKGREES